MKKVNQANELPGSKCTKDIPAILPPVRRSMKDVKLEKKLAELRKRDPYVYPLF